MKKNENYLHSIVNSCSTEDQLKTSEHMVMNARMCNAITKPQKEFLLIKIRAKLKQLRQEML